MASKSEDTTKDKGQVISEFTSYEEEANYWDTHDISDHWDKLEPVKVKFAKNLLPDIFSTKNKHKGPRI